MYISPHAPSKTLHVNSVSLAFMTWNVQSLRYVVVMGPALMTLVKFPVKFPVGLPMNMNSGMGAPASADDSQWNWMRSYPRVENCQVGGGCAQAGGEHAYCDSRGSAGDWHGPSTPATIALYDVTHNESSSLLASRPTMYMNRSLT